MNKSKLKTTFKILGCWFLIFAVVVLGFLTGYYSAKKYVRDTNSSFDSSESFEDSLISANDISYNFELDIDGLIFPLLGFRSNNGGNANNWSTLTTLNTDYSFYKSKIRLSMSPAPNGPHGESYYVSAYLYLYNNSVEYLSMGGSDNVSIGGYTYSKILSRLVDSSGGDTSALICTLVSSRSSSLSSRCVSYMTFGQDGNGNFLFPSLNFVKREIGNYTSSINPFNSEPFISDWNWSSIVNSGYYNWVRYTDSTGFTFSLAIPVYYSSNGISVRPMWYYDYSCLYYYDGSSTDYNNQEYLQGVTDGYNSGYSEGNHNGYNSGYNDGYNIGLGVGYNDGLTDGGDYSFLGLIGAVVDAPITAITGMFNFNLLGVNLKDFLFALFSLCIVITVVKFVLVK